MADVAVVVGNYEGARLLPDCLESLNQQTKRPAETLVVDAHSTDDSVAVATSHGAATLRVPNLGLGVLYNHGVLATSAEHVLLLNNDVALEPTCIDLLSSALDADADCFAADPTQIDWLGIEVIHGLTRFERGRIVGEYIPGFHLDSVAAATVSGPTISAHGAAMMVRRSLFRELGGFDETFFMEWEDLDLCWRAWRRGWPSVYVPEARVRHRVGAVTSKAIAPRRSALSHHNLMRFALKCLPL